MEVEHVEFFHIGPSRPAKNALPIIRRFVSGFAFPENIVVLVGRIRIVDGILKPGMFF